MKIGLGTVQFGMDYGVSNQDGMTPPSEVSAILQYAWANDITLLDTAAAYGNCEDILGQTIPANSSFKVVTKTPIFSNQKIKNQDATDLLNAFHNSLRKLNQPSLYGLLVHHSGDLLKDDGEYLWNAMRGLKDQGFVEKIGASVYSPLEIDGLVDRYPLDLIQLPLNVFDQRMLITGQLQHLKSRGIEIHSRSVFLQGLLLMAQEDAPSYFDNIKSHMKRYRDEMEKQGITPIKAALAFVFNLTEIDSIIIGVNNKKHLEEIVLASACIGTLNKTDFSPYAIMEEHIINPSLWKITV